MVELVVLMSCLELELTSLYSDLSCGIDSPQAIAGSANIVSRIDVPQMTELQHCVCKCFSSLTNLLFVAGD